MTTCLEKYRNLEVRNAEILSSEISSSIAVSQGANWQISVISDTESTFRKCLSPST
jgi:hypothetical protein